MITISRLTVCLMLTYFWPLTLVVLAENIVQLPEIITPIHYQLTLLPILEDNIRLCGHVWIDVTARMETNLILLHAADLTVVKAVVFPLPAGESKQTSSHYQNGQMVEDLCFNSVVYHDDSAAPYSDISDVVHHDGQNELLTIILKENMIRDTRYRIGILYNGNVYDKGESKGFFRTQYEATNHADCCKRIIGATQLEALHARKMFPCLDEPTHKATFQLMVGHSASLTAVSNMPIKLSTPMTNIEDWVWDIFDTTPPMSTYLVACVLTEFDHVETRYHSITGKNVTIRLWTSHHQMSRLDFALNLAPKVMQTLENYLNTPYSLPKLDMITIPGYEDGKAMENWGLIIHSEDSLLLDTSASDVDKALIAVTVVHELAHQWFGNLVTSTWWDDIWLNEGLTTLFETLVLAETAPELEYKTVMFIFRQEVMKNDLLLGSNSLSDPVSKYQNVDEKFDSITYTKGAAIFRMVKSFVGEGAFQSAIRRYLNRYQYSSANSTHLWNIINQEARRTYAISGRMNVARIMKTWTQQPGYPLVHVHRGKNGLVHISQRPFHASDFPIDNATMAISASWWVPISMTSSDNPRFSSRDQLPVAWLSPRNPSIEVQIPKGTDTWVLVNLESTGYFRVNYDRHNWDLLAEQLVRNHTVIPYITRTQLVDDAFCLAHAKIIPYEIPLQIIRYLSNTTDDALIRKIAQNHLEYIETINGNAFNKNPDKMKMIKSATAQLNQDKRAGRMMQYATAGFIDSDCDPVDRVCANDALRQFNALINGSVTLEKDKSVHSESIWCAAIHYGGQLEWSFAWNATRHRKLDWPEQKKMLKAMCCTTDLHHVNQLLTRVLHPTIKQSPQETTTIINRLIKNKSALPLSLNFLLTNWNFLNRHYQKPSSLEFLMSMVKHTYSVEDLAKVKVFLTEKEVKQDWNVEHILATVNNKLLLLRTSTKDTYSEHNLKSATATTLKN